MRDQPDFYVEGGKVVFTEAYHLNRGYCCRSGCRHCPYGFNKSEDGVIRRPTSLEDHLSLENKP